MTQLELQAFAVRVLSAAALLDERKAARLALIKYIAEGRRN